MIAVIDMPLCSNKNLHRATTNFTIPTIIHITSIAITLYTISFPLNPYTFVPQCEQNLAPTGTV